jgi:hypothetical protein
MRFLFRTWVVVGLSLALIVVAIVVWFRFRPEPAGPTPLPVSPGDREIVWLYQATSTAAWERFVTAVKLTEERLRDELPGIKALIDDRAFPSRSTAVPEVALTWDGAGGRIVFRWYKLTSDWKPRDWVTALVKGRPAPLAIIGGSSSDGARDLAVQLRAATADLPPEKRPLLFLTTATADLVDWPANEPEPADLEFVPPEAEGRPARVRLNAVYPGRTFRFCFSNRQMAEAIIQFLLGREDLWPDSDHAYTVVWNDDIFSRDLVRGFDAPFNRLAATFQAASSVGLPGGGSQSASLLAISALLPDRASYAFSRDPFWIESSFGAPETRNHYEVDRVGELLNKLQGDGGLQPLLSPEWKRKHSLLIVAGQTLPTRRFLRELARTEPRSARAFVVATGDALAFNTIYRDRLMTWPIQDLPFSLIMFSHANPVDAGAGFRPHAAGQTRGETVGDSGATGTEDVLLFAEIIGAAARGSGVANGRLADAPRLAERLRAARYGDGHIRFDDEGTLLFAPDGDRAGGTGEHVVCLLPQFQGGRALAMLGGAEVWVGSGMPSVQGGRVLPRATIEVWTWREHGTTRTWEQCREPLVVSYVAGEPEVSRD